MKFSHSLLITMFTGLALSACGGLGGDETEMLGETEDAVTNEDDCATGFAPNAVGEASLMASSTGDSYERKAHWANGDCGSDTREMTIVKFPTSNNHCYSFWTASVGDELVDQANQSPSNCVNTKFWGQLTYWTGADYVAYAEQYWTGTVVSQSTSPYWHCALPYGTNFKVFVSNQPGFLNTDKVKLRGKTTRADGKIATITLFGYDTDWDLCGVI